MKKIGTSIFLILFSSTTWAWNESDHQQMARFALQEVSSHWGLDQDVEMHDLHPLLKKLSVLREELGDTWHLANYLQINPKTDLAKPDPSAEGKTRLTPLEILSLYSRDPDDGRDQDLFVRDEKGRPRYAYPDQKWFGAMHGANSQAFRHIEKPPFNVKHPFNTFGYPLRAVGEATKRSEIYYQMSLLAFALGEDYWGWRFLAGSFHYLQDLHQPFHAGQITPYLVAKGLWDYILWGHKNLGVMGTFSHLVSNYHRFYESDIAVPADGHAKAKTEIFDSLKGSDTLSQTETIRDLAIRIRNDSNLIFLELICAVIQTTSPVLGGAYDFKSDQKGADHPEQFLRSGPEAEKAREKIFRITEERFRSAGRAMRTVVKRVLSERSSRKPSEILTRIDVLLYPTSS